MRQLVKASRDFQAQAISGTHTILLALDCPEPRRNGLLGFAFSREVVGVGTAKWLRSHKVFKSVVPDPKNAMDPTDPTKPRRFYTNEFPVQSFLWGDYAATPDTVYRLRITPMYGKPGALTSDPKDEITLQIRTEKEWGGEGHGVWFNRGAIASQKFAEEFGNKPPANINDPTDQEVQWLSRGLLEACLGYINETRPGDALRVAAYEFTYPPILEALKGRLDAGVDVKIVYHDTSDDGAANETAMEAAGLPIDDQQVTFRRSKTKIPHNKFIVRLKDGRVPVEVWTGSTNFTASGFLGQTNVGHRIADAETARQYLDVWTFLKTDPELAVARGIDGPVDALLGDGGQHLPHRRRPGRRGGSDRAPHRDDQAAAARFPSGTRTSGGAARAATFSLRGTGEEAREFLLTEEPLSHTVAECPYVQGDLRRLAHVLGEEHDHGTILSALNGRGTARPDCGATRNTPSGFLP